MRVLAAIALALASAVAQAASFSGDDPSCRVMSRVAYEAAQWRDGGMKWDEYLEILNVNLADALTNPNSFVKNEDDAAWIRTSLKAAFDSQDDLVRVALKMYEGCMTKAA